MDRKMNYHEKRADILKRYDIINEIQGRIGDRISELINPEGEVFFLKESSRRKDVLDKERKLLQWMERKDISTPDVKEWYSYNNKSIMIMSSLPGESAHCMNIVKNKEKLVKCCAGALKDIHSLPLDGIPSMFNDPLGNLIEEAEELINQGKVDPELFTRRNGITPSEGIGYMLSNKKNQSKSNFIHGDFCVPNVIVDRDYNYGIIDWAQGGCGDIYMDICSIVKSIKRNFGEEYLDCFYHEYGIEKEKVDKDKMYYYNLLDEFFYCESK